MTGFRWKHTISGSQDIGRELQIAQSLSVGEGQAMKFVNGKLAKAGTTDKVKYVTERAATSGSDTLTTTRVVPVDGGVFEIDITPGLEAVAVSHNVLSGVKCPMTAGSSNDLTGGLVYVEELKETHIITGNSYSGGNVTITTAQNFKRQVTTGDHVRLVFFGYGSENVQLNANGDGLDNTLAGATSGEVAIFDVDLDRKKALVTFNK